MPITTTVKASIDTDGDNINDVIFSVVPAEKQTFTHPSGADYQVKVENLTTGDIKFLKKVADVQGNEEYEWLSATIAPADKSTIDTVKVEHNEDHNRVTPTLEVKQNVKYRVAIGARRWPVEFDIKADCKL